MPSRTGCKKMHLQADATAKPIASASPYLHPCRKNRERVLPSHNAGVQQSMVITCKSCSMAACHAKII